MAGKESAADRDFVVTRVIDAPRTLVFAAWTEPAQFLKWWGPRIMTNTIDRFDARPGGSYRVVARTPDGIDYPFKGEFREIDPPRRLVMTMDVSEHPPAWHDLVKPGRAKTDTNPVGIMLVTVTFDEEGAATRLTVRTTLDSPAMLASLKKTGMDEGWSQTLERLADLVGRERPADREIVTSRLLNAPRELVFAALTDPAHIGEWWGPDGFRTVVQEMDVRPGGAWRFMMHGADGTDYPNLCIYTEVVKPERIVFEHSSDDPNDPRRFLSTITLEDRGGDTLLTMRARFLTVAARDYVLREHHAAEGGKQTLARLAKYLSA